jgi:hypothetical protein
VGLREIISLPTPDTLPLSMPLFLNGKAIPLGEVLSGEVNAPNQTLELDP